MNSQHDLENLAVMAQPLLVRYTPFYMPTWRYQD